MSLKKYLLLMFFSTLFCLTAFVFVLYYIEPNQAGIIGFVFFYSSLFLFLVGLFSIIGIFARLLFNKDMLIYKHVNTASRQAILYAALIVICFLMQSQRLLTWWNALILIFTISIVEIFFLTYKKFNR